MAETESCYLQNGPLRTRYNNWFINIKYIYVYGIRLISQHVSCNLFNCTAWWVERMGLYYAYRVRATVAQAACPEPNNMAIPKATWIGDYITPPHRTRDTRVTCPNNRGSFHLQICGSLLGSQPIWLLTKIYEWNDRWRAIDEIKCYTYMYVCRLPSNRASLCSIN